MKKYFDRPPSTMGDWLVLAAGTALLFAAVARLPAALMALGGLLGYLYGQLRAAFRRAGIAGGVGRAPAGAKHHRLCRTVGRL